MTTVYTLEAKIVYGDQNDIRPPVKLFGTLEEATGAGKALLTEFVQSYGFLDEDDSLESVLEDWISDVKLRNNWDDMPRYIEFVTDDLGEVAVAIHKHTITHSAWIVKKQIWETDPSGETDRGGWTTIIYHDSVLENRHVLLNEEEAWYIFMSLGPQAKGDVIIDTQINHLYERWWIFESADGRRWKTTMKRKDQ